jgi:hypothetical protein
VARAGSGGRRQGTPGKGYSNRTDLLTASGGMVAPARPPEPTWMSPDQVPKLDDPTARPNEPVTHGLDTGPGGGPEALGTLPGNPILASVRAAYLRNPTPELRRTLAYITSAGMT